MKTCHDVYMEPEVYHYNNCTIRVYRPILTEEERARRMEAIKKAAVDLVIAAEKAKKNKNRPFNEMRLFNDRTVGMLG